MNSDTIRLLLVEDSADDAELLLAHLEDGGIAAETLRVQDPASLEAALEKGPWDLIVSDYSMPSFTGLDALRIVRRHDPDLPFFLISGTVGEETAVAAMRAGAQDYLMKENLSRLVPAIRRELAEARMRREHRKAQEELRRREEMLNQSRKMEAIGRLAGGIAHDFNNLLTVIGGYTDLSLASIQPDHPLGPHLEQIKQAAVKAASFTRQLLAFSRKQVLAPCELDLNAVVAEISAMLRPMIRENITFDQRRAAEGVVVKADQGQIQQVIMNLIINARDAMPEGGTLFLETGKVRLEKPLDPLGGPFQPGEFAVLTVRDTGVGMDETIQAQIFEPFFTTKEAGKGTGLGLSTVYGIVSQSGGQITVESAPGKGTVVQVYLPASKGDAAEAVQPPLPSGQSRTGGETVLVAENDDGVRSLVCQVLRGRGYRVLECRDGQEALDAVLGCSPIHLLVTDMIMPRIGGRQLATLLKASHPETRILAMSGYLEETAGEGQWWTAFIPKPFGAEELAAKVREVLGPGRANPGPEREASLPSPAN